MIDVGVMRFRSLQLRNDVGARSGRISHATCDEVPPLSPRLALLRGCLITLLVLMCSLVVQAMIVSGFQHSAAQQRSFDRLRNDLAEGTAPIGPADDEGHPLPGATPVAFIEIPSIGVREVVGEGTTSSNLFQGPGHMRDTPLPGQVGTSTIVGRRATYGAPFRRIRSLETGDEIIVTTGQGTFQYKVIGVRHEGDPVPDPLPTGSSRLVLATADGRAFMPGGVVRVDADLDGTAVGGAPRQVTADSLSPDERLMASDTSTAWALALWIQGLIALSIGAIWAWHRWGHLHAWVVFLPPLMLVGLSAAGEFARLLPNLT